MNISRVDASQSSFTEQSLHVTIVKVAHHGRISKQVTEQNADVAVAHSHGECEVPSVGNGEESWVTLKKAPSHRFQASRMIWRTHFVKVMKRPGFVEDGKDGQVALGEKMIVATRRARWKVSKKRKLSNLSTSRRSAAPCI